MGVLDGRVALVTGGSRGIGAAIVRRLAADGAGVVFSHRASAEAADAVVADVAKAGGRAVAVRADQGEPAGLDALFGAVEREFGALDILVLNAARAETGTIADTDEAGYDRMMAINARGPFFAIRRAGAMLRDGGRIIAVSTVNTVLPEPGIALYAASKAALEQFTRIAAREYGGRGITANIVSPGATDTDMLRDNNAAEDLAGVPELTALGRLGRPDDIANVVAFLAGPDSAWITGQNLTASGGLLV